MNALYVMVFGAILSLGVNGIFEATYKALQEGGPTAAASTLLSSTRQLLKEQDQSTLIQERELHRTQARWP